MSMLARQDFRDASSTLRSVTLLRQMIVGARLLRTKAIDALLHVDTAQSQGSGGNPVVDRFGDGVPFAALDYVAIHRCLKSVELRPSDVFVDIGCGNGRVLCLAARRRVRKCVGIEYRPALARQAVRNARSLRGRRCPIEIIAHDAADSDFSEGTVFWMFNPFGEQTMRRVTERIIASQRSHPRRVRLIYVRPLHAPMLRTLGFIHTGTVLLPSFNAGTASCWTRPPDNA